MLVSWPGRRSAGRLRPVLPIARLARNPVFRRTVMAQRGLESHRHASAPERSCVSDAGVPSPSDAGLTSLTSGESFPRPVARHEQTTGRAADALDRCRQCVDPMRQSLPGALAFRCPRVLLGSRGAPRCITRPERGGHNDNGYLAAPADVGHTTARGQSKQSEAGSGRPASSGWRCGRRLAVGPGESWVGRCWRKAPRRAEAGVAPTETGRNRN